MAASFDDLARMLDDAWDAKAQLTLREQLRLQETAVGALISQGSLASVSKNSTSQSYATPGNGLLTTAEVARGWRDLIRLYDFCNTVIQDAGGAFDEAAIYGEMQARLLPVYQSRPDISLMRALVR